MATKPSSPSKKTPVEPLAVTEAIPDAAASALGGVRAAAALSGGKRSGGSISHTRKTKIDLVEGPYPMAVKVKHIESGGASQKAELCLLPCEYQLQPAKLLDLVKNTWRLELPNLIVACDIGSAHPLQLGTTMLAELPQFQSWLADAQRHRAAAADRAAGIAPVAAEATDAVPSSSFAAGSGGGEKSRRRGGAKVAPAAPAAAPAAAEATADDLELINTLIFQKMISTMAAVLDAACLSNNWILIDRTSNRSAKSATAELLLELAMEQTDQRPTVLVIDTVERLEEFDSVAAREQLELLRRLGRSAMPIGDYEENATAEPVEWPYVPSEYLDPHAFDDKQLPREPFEAHKREDGTVSDKRKWMYHYNQCLFGSGTHYIILDTADDAFDFECLGTIGNVVAHGGTLAYRRLRSHILLGHPTVLLYNTGGATQAFGSLLRALARRLASGTGELPSSDELLRKIELVTKEKWASTFGLPEIMLVKELAERAPQLFRRTIVTCDLVNDSAEQVLETLTSCFAGGAGGVPELGLGGAETNCVYVAWKRHLSLYTNAQRFRKWSTVVQYFIYVFAMLTTIMSVVYSYFSSMRYVDSLTKEILTEAGVEGAAATAVTASLDDGLLPDNYEDLDWETMLTWMSRAVILLPLLSALFSTIRSRMRSRDKYAQCLVASHEVAAEIYKYRCRTLEYDMTSSSLAAEAAGVAEEEEKGGKSPEQLKRELFIARVQNIYARAMDGELSSGGALRHTGFLAANIEAPRERAVFVEKLRAHVLTNVYEARLKARKELLEEYEEQRAEQAHDGGEKKTKVRTVEPDDLATQMSIETYVQYRVRPYAAHLEKLAPRLSRRLQALELLVFVCNTAGAVLAIIEVGATSLATFVAITVALAATFSSVIEFHNLQAQVTAANGALREVHNLLVWWAGLSMVDRRTRFTKFHVVSTLERCLLSTVAAEASAVIQGDTGDGADKNSGDGD